MNTLFAILNITTGLGVILLIMFTTYTIGKMFSTYILRNNKKEDFFTNVFFGIGFIIVMFFIVLIAYCIGTELVNSLFDRIAYMFIIKT